VEEEKGKMSAVPSGTALAAAVANGTLFGGTQEVPPVSSVGDQDAAREYQVSARAKSEERQQCRETPYTHIFDTHNIHAELLLQLLNKL
jgi:hypothetical protein